jgi:hypothetical protein
MNNNFLLEISSDLDYEGMVINISYKNDIIAILNQDKGVDNIEIKIFSSINDECWNFIYKDFTLFFKFLNNYEFKNIILNF